MGGEKMKLFKIILAATLDLGVSTTSLLADPIKGQKLFIKKLKKPCGFNGAKFALKHSQEEWKNIFESGKFEDEIIKICPQVKKGAVKESWLQHKKPKKKKEYTNKIKRPPK